jgi:HlyD family secretion protein
MNTNSRALLVVSFAAIVVLTTGCSASSGPRAGAVQTGTAAPAAQTTADAEAVQARSAYAEGKLVPARDAALSFTQGGRIAEVLVSEGDAVQEDQALVRLESVQQAAAVAQAEAGLQRARAQRDELKAGARPEEIASAQAALDGAKARLERLQNGDDIKAAEAATASARAALAKLREGAASGALIAGQNDVANAEAALSQAAAAYDRVKGNADIASRPESLALEQTTNAYNAARARLADLQKGATPADLNGAQARVAQAQAQLDAIRTTRSADIAAAEAELRGAQAQLELVRNGARPEAIAAAEADVAAAEATLAQARAELDQTTLRAPFAGVIARLYAVAGEDAAPGAAMAQIADVSAWRVETTDLTELNVVNVKEGDQVTLTFDALPGETFGGQVERIRPLGEVQKGDMTYAVVIRPDRLDPRLRWNMTASVGFAE